MPPNTSTRQHHGADSSRSASGHKTPTARNTAAIYFPALVLSLCLSLGRFSLCWKGTSGQKSASKVVESFDSQWSESWLHMAAACTNGASCWADLPRRRASPGHQSKGPPTSYVQPMASPALLCLGPNCPFSTGIAKTNSRQYLLGVMLSITLI